MSGATHHSREHSAPASRVVRLTLGIAVGVFVIATAIAVAVLWPTGENPKSDSANTASIEYVNATVTKVEPTTCGPTIVCHEVSVRIDAGNDEGQVVLLPKIAIGTSAPKLEAGDEVVVSRVIQLGIDGISYSFSGFQRGRALFVLALIFAVIVVAVARWRGIAAIGGLVATWFILIMFIIPAILQGESPIAVALAGSALIMIVVLYLAHGVNSLTTTALLGTLVSLGVTGSLAWIFVNAAHLSGLSEEAAYIQGNSGVTVDLSGLLLCGIIIGSLGVLNDVTVTQASAVWEIHAANPSQSVRRLYRSGMRIGRDHIASTVDTLVLAYGGASLPLLMLFILGNQRFGDVVTGDFLAEEIVRTLVGSIGLVVSVPLTTLLAAAVASRQTSAPSTRQRIAERAKRGATDVATGAAAVASGAKTRADDAANELRDRRREAKEAKRAAWEPPSQERDFWDE